MQMNDIQTVWRYATLQWQNVTKNIPKISELFPDLWWMDKRQYSTPCNPCLKNFPFLRINHVHILKEIKVQEGKNLPCDSRSARLSLSLSTVMGLAALEPIFNV
jgi:hypothetical protein